MQRQTLVTVTHPHMAALHERHVINRVSMWSAYVQGVVELDQHSFAQHIPRQGTDHRKCPRARVMRRTFDLLEGQVLRNHINDEALPMARGPEVTQQLR